MHLNTSNITSTSASWSSCFELFSALKIFTKGRALAKRSEGRNFRNLSHILKRFPEVLNVEQLHSKLELFLQAHPLKSAVNACKNFKKLLLTEFHTKFAQWLRLYRVQAARMKTINNISLIIECVSNYPPCSSYGAAITLLFWLHVSSHNGKVTPY